MAARRARRGDVHERRSGRDIAGCASIARDDRRAACRRRSDRRDRARVSLLATARAGRRDHRHERQVDDDRAHRQAVRGVGAADVLRRQPRQHADDRRGRSSRERTRRAHRRRGRRVHARELRDVSRARRRAHEHHRRSSRSVRHDAALRRDQGPDLGLPAHRRRRRRQCRRSVGDARDCRHSVAALTRSIRGGVRLPSAARVRVPRRSAATSCCNGRPARSAIRSTIS